MQNTEKHYKAKTTTEIQEMKFMPNEKVLVNGKPCIIVNPHPKKAVYYVRMPSGYSWWFDECNISKIEPVKEPVTPTPKKQTHDSNAELRAKHSKKGTKSFLMLED